MKIGIVLARVPGYSETFFKSKVTGLIKAGHDVTLFVNKKGKKDFEGAKVRSCILSNSNPLVRIIISTYSLLLLLLLHTNSLRKYFAIQKKSGLRIKEILRRTIKNAHILEYKMDWLHFGFATMALECEHVSYAIGAQMAISVRGYDISIYPLKHKGCYDDIWPCVNKYHVISDDLKEKLYFNGVSDNSTILKITPAIDYENFYRKRNSMNNESMVKIVSIGRLHWKKGFEYGLEALAELKSKGISFKYFLIGSGDELERLKYAAYQLGLQENVAFLGAQDVDGVSTVLKDADIYFQPSLQEGFGNAVLEAQASGCICVVSDAEGLSENILHNETGFVFPKRDIESMVNSLVKAINLQTADRQCVVDASQKRVKELYSIDKQIEKFISFYED